MAENNLLTGSGIRTDFYNIPQVQPSQAVTNPLMGFMQAQQAAQQGVALDQAKFDLGKARLHAIHDEMGALATIPGGPTYDNVMQRITGLVQSGMLGPGEVQRILPNIPGGDGPEGNAARKSFFDQQLQLTGDYKSRMAASYGQPGGVNLGDSYQPTMGNVRTGAQTPAGPGMALGMSPESKASRVNGVTGGVPFTAPQSSFVDRGGYALPAPAAPQPGVGAPATMAPRALTNAPPPMPGPPAITSPGQNPDGTPRPPAQAPTIPMGGLPAGAIQSQQGPGVDVTANAQATANQQRAAALQEDAARAPERKAALARLQSYADTFTSGPASPYLKKAGGIVNQVAGAAGFQPPIASQAAREAFDKDAAILAGQLSSSLGGTDAGRALASVMTPGASNSNDGIRNIVGVLNGLEDAKTAKNQAWDNYRRAFPPGQADYGHFETEFHKTFSPRAFTLPYMSPAERQKTWNSMSEGEQKQVQRAYDAAKAQGYLKPPASQ